KRFTRWTTGSTNRNVSRTHRGGAGRRVDRLPALDANFVARRDAGRSVAVLDEALRLDPDRPGLAEELVKALDAAGHRAQQTPGSATFSEVEALREGHRTAGPARRRQTRCSSRCRLRIGTDSHSSCSPAGKDVWARLTF